MKIVLWRVAKCLSYIEEARCLKINCDFSNVDSRPFTGATISPRIDM